MRKCKQYIMAGALSALIFSAPQEAEAYDYLGAAWCCDTIRVCVGDGDLSHLCSFGTNWFSMVTSAMSTWNGMNTPFYMNVSFTAASGCAPDTQDSCRFAPTMDGQNTVSIALDCDLPAGFLAVAMVWTNTETCCIEEADMCFATLEGTSDFWYQGIGTTGNCPGNCFDVQTVALHEFGHWAGLGHEDDNVGGVKQVMHSATGICDFRRNFTPDDSAGLYYIYGTNSVIQQSDRCNTAHNHPTYPTSTKEATTGHCPETYCYGSCQQPPGTDFDGDGFCDTVDNCVTTWNRDQSDLDGDNWGDSCDCAPSNSAVFPGATEICNNSIDDDCNGLTDGADPACGPTACCNVAGDANNDGAVNIADVTFLIARIFAGGPPPPCCEEGSANGDGSINIADVTFLIARIFGGGPPPTCGPAGMSCLGP